MYLPTSLYLNGILNYVASVYIEHLNYVASVYIEHLNLLKIERNMAQPAKVGLGQTDMFKPEKKSPTYLYHPIYFLFWSEISPDQYRDNTLETAQLNQV